MRRTGFLAGFALLTIILSRVLGRESAFVEKFYYGGLFQFFRTIYDYTLGFLPIPMMYVFILIIAFCIYVIIKSFLKSDVKGIKRIKKPLSILINVLSVLVLCFYWFWGFNYNRQSIESTVGLDYTKMDTTDLMIQYESTVRALVDLNSKFDKEEKIEAIQVNPTDFETSCRQSLTTQLDELSYCTNGRVRIRRLRPQGALLRISTAGVYWPFVFEGHIDPGLHPLTWSFTMTHEMGHGYGFTDEGTCNFLGWLGCVNNDDPFIQYSGWIGYLRYVLSNLRGAISEDSYRDVYMNLPSFVKTDLSEIRAYAMRYPDILPAIRDVFYDNYLKTHGVEGGLINYSKVVKLVYAWELKADKYSN